MDSPIKVYLDGEPLNIPIKSVHINYSYPATNRIKKVEFKKACGKEVSDTVAYAFYLDRSTYITKSFSVVLHLTDKKLDCYLDVIAKKVRIEIENGQMAYHIRTYAGLGLEGEDEDKRKTP